MDDLLQDVLVLDAFDNALAYSYRRLQGACWLHAHASGRAGKD